MNGRIDADLLARLDPLRIDARSLADSVLSGTHPTRRIGTSIDFAEHREYRPGDDPRHLDPRVLGRTDRDVIRRFHHESELRAIVALDTSASMSFSSRPALRQKRDYAARLLLGLSYVLLRQGDRVGAVDLGRPMEGFVPFSTGHAQLERIESMFESGARERPSRLREGLLGLASHATRRSLVVIASDFLDDDADVLEELAMLTARGHVVALLHVLDPCELDLDLEGAYQFHGLEGEPEVVADVDSVRDAYLAEVKRFITGVARAAEVATAVHALARTDAPEESHLALLAGGGDAR